MDVASAEVVLPCGVMRETLAFFVDLLGFRLHAIFPADDPSEALLVGHGLRLRLQRDGAGGPGVLRLGCVGLATGEQELRAPNGTLVQLRHVGKPLELPPLRPELTIARQAGATWIEGRAGMRYRDLIPRRQGGRFVASHIVIPDAGPVPDYVHYHVVRLQFIYCWRGWVRLVYEDQGDPFVLAVGDCVLQPPQIRHRVLESSGNLEVVELGCPAAHETLVDHDMQLPTPTLAPQRSFGGQRFVRHEAASATWAPHALWGFQARTTGIAAATEGLAAVEVLRAVTADLTASLLHAGELLLLVVLAGEITLTRPGGSDERLVAGDAVAIPAGLAAELRDPSPDVEILRVAMPA